MFLKKYIWLSAATLLTACDLIDYHPYDGRLDSDTSLGDQPDQYRAYRESLRRERHDPFYFYGRYPAEL